MIKNFRYDSTWEDYSRMVAQVEELLDQGKARWQIGCLYEIDLDVDADVHFEYDAWNILYDEILFMIIMGLQDSPPSEERVRDALKPGVESLREQQIEDMITLVMNKYELAYDTFHVEELKEVYCLRKESIMPKLSAIDYNVVERRAFSGKRYQEAQISITAQRRLPEIPYKPSTQAPRDCGSEISFICGRDNIDYLIRVLQEIKDGMRED